MSESGHYSRNGFLTKRGIELAQRTSLEGLASRDEVDYVDSRVSVSGLELERDLYEFVLDSQIDEQARRFHNGT